MLKSKIAKAKLDCWHNCVKRRRSSENSWKTGKVLISMNFTEMLNNTNNISNKSFFLKAVATLNCWLKEGEVLGKCGNSSN